MMQYCTEKSRLKNTVGVSIFLEMESQGYSQRELAYKANVMQSQISRVINGKILPDLITLLKICNVLNISVDSLL